MTQPKVAHLNVYQSLWDQQNQVEFAFLLAHMAGAGRILEIGSCFGQSLQLLAMFCAPGAVIRSIDLGVVPEGHLKGLDLKPQLHKVCSELANYGFDVQACFDDSHLRTTRHFALASAPYDLVFIDGDHTYDGVKADWENYGPLARLVAFHDIAHTESEVSKLWAEIKQSGYETTECVASQFGMGIVLMKRPSDSLRIA